MFLTKEQVKKYTCKLGEEFFVDYAVDREMQWWNDGTLNQEQQLDSNDLLAFLYDYSGVSDKSKQYFYYMCKKTFNDVPSKLVNKYEYKFGIEKCGNEIYNSYGCVQSNLLINCNDIHQSFGCDRCKFSHHLLYCTEQRHKSYMAFNKEVTKQRFNELIKMSPEELHSVPEFNGGIYTRINSLIEYIYKLKDGT